MSYSLTLNYDAASNFTYNTSLVEVASSTLRLKDQGGGTYTTTPQLVTCQERFAISALSSFSEVSTVPANTSITYQIVLGPNTYYWNSVTSLWTLATGGASQANSASVISAHASTLISNLSILTPQYFGLNVYLTSTSGAARPVLTSNAIGYSWSEQAQSVINECVITAYFLDLVGAVPNPVTAQLLVACDHGFFHGSNFISPFTKTFAFNSSGVVTASIIETQTPGVKLNFSITYTDGISTYSSKLFNAIIPNQASANLTNVTTAYPYNFG